VAQLQNTFSQALLEKLIPGARKPVSDITITMMAPGIDMAEKARLKMELQKCWTQCSQRMDHRAWCENTEAVDFSKQTHYIAKSALKEFERQKKLYKQYYTVGLKIQVDRFAQSKSKDESESKYDVSGWRLGSSNVNDFRRKGERLLLVSGVSLVHSQGSLAAKTSDMSNGGCLLLVEPEQAEHLVLLDKVTIEFSELVKKYALDQRHISYQIVDIKPSSDAYRIALKRTDEGDSSEFEQLLLRLMGEHKRRNRLDVDNTIRALSARSYNMASVAQLNSLIVMSNRNNRYHLLISQGHNISLQAELMLDKHLIPHMVENNQSGGCKLFFVWALSQNEVFITDLESMAQNDTFESTLKIWGNAVWHKAFLVKSDPIDAQLADLGTSIPSGVSPVANKLNAPLPVKVAQFARELGKISLLEDVTYVLDSIKPLQSKTQQSSQQSTLFRVKKSTGNLRQMPFNVKELPNFYGTYRFSHDCELTHQGKNFKIVNGHADCRDALVSIPLDSQTLKKGNKVSITWMIGELRISLDAAVVEHNKLHKRLALCWCDNPQMVKQLFKELEKLNAFDLAFKEDVQANRLDAAVRNMVLSNLPKVAIFAQSKRQAIALKGLTGHQHLPKYFIDNNNRVRLDALFSQQILLNLANSAHQHKEILFVALEGGKIIDRRLISEFSSPKLMLKVLQHLCKMSTLFIFALDVSHTREKAEDAIVNIENKYLRHYSPGKAKKLEASLAFNLSIQLTDISAMFRSFIGMCR
jgi:hypothetical protein